MALRVFMVVLLLLMSPGALLHNALEGCHDSHNCPICHQLQGNPAESVSETTYVESGTCTCEIVMPPVSHAQSRVAVSPATPRAPPAA